MSTASIKQELRRLLVDIEAQIDAIKEAVVLMNVGVPALQMRNADGSFTLVPLLAAKAQVLLALAYLEK